ncbi:LysR family transcriptional regulator [Agarivorans sp. MS3-6]|uniref:LysR family transcriptional regulator n=1 Tax=Agarivorans sp. TSD2052 TaxID=2937286 RepID=UPI0020105592|nr:LysR family transcriptional regulator [Agarivorans sp. TSD2052]UPW17058.1 LysR family transcriptional regulator [Agarivorans sp. TSD2052]
MYSLRQLQAFVATCEQGSFKLAAIALNKRASTVAELVSTLEDESNTQLFERQTRKLVLTESGKHLLPVAKATVREASCFSAVVDNLHQAVPTTFSVAIDSMLSHPAISRSYQVILQQFPNIELEVLVGDTLQVVDWITTNKAEIGLVASALSEFENITQFTAFNFELVEVASSQQFTRGEVVSNTTMRELLQLQFKHLAQFNLDKRYQIGHRICYVNNLQEMLNMVSEGVGWAFLPRTIAQPWIDAGKIVEFSIEGGTPVYWFAEIVHLSAKEPSLAGDVFMQEVMNLKTFESNPSK